MRASPSEPKPTRRRFLKGGIALGAIAAMGGVVALVRTGGYALSADVRDSLVALSPWQYIFVQAVARRIAAPDRPDDPTIPTPDDVDVAGFIDAYVAKMPAPLRRDLLRFFAVVEHVAPLRLGLAPRFTRLSPDDQDRVLASLEAGPSDLLRGAFDGLKSLVFMGYYRDARTWKILGYDGPLDRHGRPRGVDRDEFRRGRDLSKGDVTLDADAVVVGTGAGGSIALRELARAGLKAVALEEGGSTSRPTSISARTTMLPLLFQDMGGRTTSDLAIRVLQGRGVGGSTVHNTNLCKRTPDEVLDALGAALRRLGADPADDAPGLRADRGATCRSSPMLPEWQNGNNQALRRRGRRRSGWRGGPL